MNLNLDRNKIYEIGKEKSIKTVRIEQQDIKTSKCLQRWQVYKMIRRNIKVYAYSHTGRLTFTFDTVINAKKLIKQFNEGTE